MLYVSTGGKRFGQVACHRENAFPDGCNDLFELFSTDIQRRHDHDNITQWPQPDSVFKRESTDLRAALVFPGKRLAGRRILDQFHGSNQAPVTDISHVRQ